MDSSEDTDPGRRAAKEKLKHMEDCWTNSSQSEGRSIEDVMFVGEFESAATERSTAEKQLFSSIRELASLTGFMEYYGLAIAGQELYVYKFTSSAIYKTPKIFYNSNPAYLSRVFDLFMVKLDPQRYCRSFRPSQLLPTTPLIRLPHDCQTVLFEGKDDVSRSFQILGLISKDPTFVGRSTTVYRVIYWKGGIAFKGVLKLSNVDCRMDGQEVKVYHAIGDASPDVKKHLAEAVSIWQGPASFGIEPLGASERGKARKQRRSPHATERKFTAILLKEEYQSIASVTEPSDVIKLSVHILSGK